MSEHSGENHKKWKGEQAGYIAKHQWVRKHKPNPADGRCEKCGRKDEQLELANISGDYKRDVNDFQWTCHRCNMRDEKTQQKLRRWRTARKKRTEDERIRGKRNWENFKKTMKKLCN